MGGARVSHYRNQQGTRVKKSGCSFHWRESTLAFFVARGLVKVGGSGDGVNASQQQQPCRGQAPVSLFSRPLLCLLSPARAQVLPSSSVAAENSSIQGRGSRV